MCACIPAPDLSCPDLWPFDPVLSQVPFSHPCSRVFPSVLLPVFSSPSHLFLAYSYSLSFFQCTLRDYIILLLYFVKVHYRCCIERHDWITVQCSNTMKWWCVFSSVYDLSFKRMLWFYHIMAVRLWLKYCVVRRATIFIFLILVRVPNHDVWGMVTLFVLH